MKPLLLHRRPDRDTLRLERHAHRVGWMLALLAAGLVATFLVARVGSNEDVVPAVVAETTAFCACTLYVLTWEALDGLRRAIRRP